jgi:hypothetical protein
MLRIPRVCLVLVVVVLLALLTAPLAGARPVTPSSAHPAASGWLSAALHWAADLAGLRSHGHRPPSVQQKDTTGGIMQPSIGQCIDPFGHPVPCTGN